MTKIKKLRIFTMTQGCALNHADTHAMKHQLHKAGMVLVDNQQEADVIVYNTCTVKNKTAKTFRKNMRKFNKPVVVAGCIAQASPDLPILEGKTLIGTEQISNIASAVIDAYEQRPTRRLEKSHEHRLGFPAMLNKGVAIVPICKGCLSNCSYCHTKYARGDLESFSMRGIKEHVIECLNKGANQIWLTSQDCGAYGLDINTNIAQLLQHITQIPGDFKIRLGMANPLFFDRFLDDFIKVMQSPKMFRFLHIPIQSGSDKVLRVMRRGYTVAKYTTLIKKLRCSIPGLTIATDIIVGHPGEDSNEFEKTCDMLNQIQPHVINYSRFSARPNTYAATLDAPSKKCVDQRIAIIRKIIERLIQQHLETYKTWNGSVMVEQIRKVGTVVARTPSYTPVVVHGTFAPGEQIDVKITGVSSMHCVGERIQLPIE